MQPTTGLIALLTLVLPVAATAADYTFTKIADDTVPGLGFISGSGNIAINSGGTVVFRAFRSDSRGAVLGDLILAGSGGALTTIADTLGTFRNLFPTSINSNGVAAFVGVNRDLSTGIYIGSGGPVSTIALSGLVGPVTAASLADINDDGVIAYSAANTIPVVSGGSDRTVDPNGIHFATSMGQLNRSGALVFLSTRAGELSLVTDKAGVVSTVALESGPLGLVASRYPAINDNGTVVVSATADGIPPKPGIFKIDGTQITPVSTSGAFGLANINNSGTVAFGRLQNSVDLAGIYAGPDPAADKVIALGDTLFGSKVSGLDGVGRVPGRFLNDRGQIAFYYTLANSTKGVAVATPAAASDSAPVLPADSILNAASLTATPPLSPGSVVSIFGDRFASQLLVASTANLPTSLSGTSVTFNGTPAPLYFASPKQINVQIPTEISTASALVQVHTAAGQSETRTLTLGVLSPGIYTLPQSGAGQGIVTFAGTATLVAPRGTTPDSRPARAGDILTIYANGLGPVTPPIASGQTSCGGVCAADGSNLILRQAVTAPVIEIAGDRVAPADILFAGLAPQFVGLYQINFRLPAGIPVNAAATVVLRQGTPASRTDVTIATE